jgi:hypothetical protein
MAARLRRDWRKTAATRQLKRVLSGLSRPDLPLARGVLLDVPFSS